jgi:hypothetical protein
VTVLDLTSNSKTYYLLTEVIEPAPNSEFDTTVSRDVMGEG